MPIVEGTHPHGRTGEPCRYRVDYRVVGRTVHYSAEFPGRPGDARREGQFDFEPAQIDAANAVHAFMQNLLKKADFDAAPP